MSSWSAHFIPLFRLPAVIDQGEEVILFLECFEPFDGLSTE